MRKWRRNSHHYSYYSSYHQPISSLQSSVLYKSIWIGYIGQGKNGKASFCLLYPACYLSFFGSKAAAPFANLPESLDSLWCLPKMDGKLGPLSHRLLQCQAQTWQNEGQSFLASFFETLCEGLVSGCIFISA